MTEAAGQSGWKVVLWRAVLLSLASNAAVIFCFFYGQFFWPDGLPGWAQHIFWLPSGVNIALILFFGIRYTPVILLDAIPVWLFLNQPLDACILGAATNTIEVAFAVWIIRYFGRYTQREPLSHMRPTGALLVASMVAPLTNTVITPFYFASVGIMAWQEVLPALGNWNLSNGSGILLLTPLIWACRRGEWNWGARKKEMLFVILLAMVLSVVAFKLAFRGTGLNFAFLVFPVVIYVAVRFGWSEVSLTLAAMAAVIYITLGWNATVLPPGELAAVIWFIQAFIWVLSATGFLIAALSAQRREAERLVLEERGHALEASLQAERTRLAALRYQINPHFLFNALNSVRSTLPLSEAVGRDMLTDLSGYLRSTLATDAEQVPLREEIRSVQEYLRIEERRFTSRLRTRYEIDPALHEIEVPAFLLQPLVENAIRHGLEQSREPCEIFVSAQREEGSLRLEVANSGAWREARERQGIGLENIRRRLSLLYPERASLEILKTEGRVRVQIILPI